MSKDKRTELWDSVQRTDPAYTKDYKGAGGFSGTAINTTYLVKKATETFGPVGSGWGYSVIEDRFDEGGPISDNNGAFICNSQVHTIRLLFWYMNAGERKELEHYGHTPYVSKNKYGVQTDMEAPKKSLTDALKKCLSMLGFGADIHMGMYEDTDYRMEIASIAEVEKAEDKEAALERQKQERLEWLKESVGILETATTMGELKKEYAHFVRSATRRREDNFVKRLAQAYEKREAELQEKEQVA